MTGLLAAATGGLPHAQKRNVRLQLANTLLLGGDYGRALPHYEWLVADVGAERGNEDPDLLAWRVQAAVCRDAMGQPADALELLVPVLRSQRQRHGASAPEVVELRRQVALLKVSAGQAEHAAADLRSLVDDLGPGHPDVAELREILRRLGGTGAE